MRPPTRAPRRPVAAGPAGVPVGGGTRWRWHGGIDLRARTLAVLALGLLVAGGLVSLPAASAETLVGSNLDSRVVVALRAPRQSAVQSWLPAPWTVEPIPSGPSATANVLVLFVERILSQDPEGKTNPDANTRGVAVGVPARNPETGESALFVIRILAGTPGGVPGPYKNSVLATVNRQQAARSDGPDRIVGEEAWTARDGEGKTIELSFQYERGTPARMKTEANVRSASDPSIHRIYRVDQGVDVVRSGPAGIEHVRNLQFRVAVPSLTSVLDGSERVVSVAILPWYSRQIFLP